MKARLLCVVGFSALLSMSAFAQSTIGFTYYGSAVQENAGTVQLSVIRTGSLTGSAQVDYETRDGDAIPNVDYVPASGTLHFGNGESAKTISVTVIDDNVTDAKRSTIFGIWLHDFVHSSGNEYYEYSLEIKDDEPPPPPLTLSVQSNLTFSEGDGVTNTTLTFSLNKPHDELVWFTFRYVPVAGATAGVSVEGVRFEPGETTKQVPLRITGNNVYDGNGSSTYHFMPTQATWDPVVSSPFEITIVDDDALATVSISDISVAEGSCGPTPIEVTLTADAPVTGIVHWAASDGSATGSDIDWGPYGPYEPVHFANATTGKITLIAPYGDLKIEGNEAFTVTLTSATNMAIGDGTATVTIENDDEELPQFAEDLVRVEAGKSTMLRIDFPAPAPAGSVQLSSSDPRVQVPASVSVPQQATFVTFTADATAAAGPVTVTASLAGALGATQIIATVDAFIESDLHFDLPRRSVFAGETAAVSLDLTPARTEPVIVTLEASPGIVVPETAVVPPGGFATFPFTSLAAGTGWIIATHGESSTSIVVDVIPQTLASFAPEIAPTAGGSVVTVKGVGFSPGCTAAFGNVAAETTFVDEETLIAKTPAHAAEAVNLTVTCGTTPVTASKDFQFATPRRRASRH